MSSSHYERNIGPLAASGYHVFAIDYLGQGKSWPDKDPEKEDQLVLSIDTWSEQIISFIRDVIGRPVYISGNSLGGFLATTVAARHYEWIRGVVLLNSTPFWSFAPNRKKMHPWVKEVSGCRGRLGRKKGQYGPCMLVQAGSPVRQDISLTFLQNPARPSSPTTASSQPRDPSTRSAPAGTTL